MNNKIFMALSRLVMVVLIMAGIVFVASNVLAESSVELRKAIGSYKSADYDGAIEQLGRIASDESADLEDRKDALRYLGRCYVAKRLTDKAKDSIQELLTLEPPIVEFDPDRESPPMMKVYYEARKDYSNGSYQIERADPGLKTMAVIDFKNRSIFDREKFEPMEKGFADIVINRLNGSTQLKVVERDRLQWVLNELNIQDQYNMEGAVRAGKQLGVHAVLMGSFMIHKKDEIWISARLVKVETSEILLTEEVKGKVDKFFDLSDKLSKKVAESIDSGIKLSAVDDGEESNSLEAMLAYSEGLNFLETGEYEKAHDKFAEAIKYDPSYHRAHLKMESIGDLVGNYAAN